MTNQLAKQSSLFFCVGGKIYLACFCDEIKSFAEVKQSVHRQERKKRRMRSIKDKNI